MQKKVIIYYFTGTGNTLFLLRTLRKKLLNNGFECDLVDISKIPIGQLELSDKITYGFAFPVYAFGLPDIFYRFIQNLPKCKTSIESFVIANYGGHHRPVMSMIRKFIKKNTNIGIVANIDIVMPHNGVAVYNSPTEEVAKQLIEKGKTQISEFADKLIAGERVNCKNTNIVETLLGKIIYWFFRLGLKKIYKRFKVDKECNSYGYCAKICPMNNITMIDNKPKWGSNCEMCLRCLNYCPQKAIQILRSRQHRRYNMLPFE